MTPPVWAQVAYLVAAVSFILTLKGLSSPRTARRANGLGAAGALLAVVVTFFAYDIDNLMLILLAIVVGTAAGTAGARRVAMTAMPQLVALFNGVGGGAAALVALLELGESGGDAFSVMNLMAIAFTALVGAVSFSGSVVTFLKLQELMTTRPVLFPGGPAVFGASLFVSVVLAALTVGSGSLWWAIALCIVGLVVGVLLVLLVLAVAAGGYVLGNSLLLVAGTLVGASGTILTRAMARAMGRPVTGILFGAFRSGSGGPVGSAGDRFVKSAEATDIAILLGYARKVVVVPGYGLAVAQAQHVVQELADVLTERGVTVTYAIHPVAGRMPGHMNVLLAEANVPYERLLEMETANPELRTADVTLVVGANDVVNPAARTSPGSPIYGMPILDADQSEAVVFLKRSMRPGFAGIENELLYDARTTLLFGDAKESLTKLVVAVKNL